MHKDSKLASRCEWHQTRKTRSLRVASDTSSEYSRVASQNEYSFHSRVLASTRYSRVDVPLLEAGTVIIAN